MKLIVAITQKYDGNAISSRLTKKGFYITKLPGYGGFLQKKNMIILCGVEDNKVNKVLNIIEQESCRRVEDLPSMVPSDQEIGSSYPLKVSVGGATIFVLNVEQFEKL